LFKNPKDVLRFIEAQGPIKTVNVGNMSYKEGAREVTKSIQVLPEEEQIFETIASKGVTVTAQLVPNDPVVDFMKNYAAKTARLRKNIFKFRRKFQCI
ncbi:PTS sugar transporter subunit IIB, partial [Enterococcus faecalis]